MARLKKILLLAGKIAVLWLVAHMAALQVPELAYDLSAGTPAVIASPEELAGIIPDRPVFVAVHGRANFGDAFSYQRYGLTFTYFTLKPYGRRIVVRTHDRVTEEWTMLDRFLGKLRPFGDQPFSYRIEEIFRDKHGVRIPADAYFLALDDVPEVSGWQVGALLFSALLWGGLCHLFFFYRGPLFQSPRAKGRRD